MKKQLLSIMLVFTMLATMVATALPVSAADESGQLPFSLEIVSDIVVSELHTTERTGSNGETYVAYDWFIYGECDIIFDYPEAEGCDNIADRDILPMVSGRYTSLGGYQIEFYSDGQETEPWEPGNTYDAKIKLSSFNSENAYEEIMDVRVTVEALNIESISAEDYSWTPYTDKKPVITVTHKDGTTSTPTPEYNVRYDDKWPTEPGTYELQMSALDGQYTFPIKLTVLDMVTSGQCGDTMNWSFDKDSGTLTISGTGAMYSYGPDGNEAVWWRYPIRHVVIGEGVESLCEYSIAFEYTVEYDEGEGQIYDYLESIQLPKSLTKLPKNEFFHSELMETLVIPEGITSITEWSFTVRNLKELYLPKTLTKVDLMVLLWATLNATDDNTLSRESTSLEKIHFEGTEEEWKAIQHVKAEDLYYWLFDEYFDLYDSVTGEYIGDDAFYAAVEDVFAQVEVVYEFAYEEIPEKITIENGTATVPDSVVDVTEGEDVTIDLTDTEEKVESVIIGSSTIDKITNANTNVEVKLPDAAVSFDKDAVSSIGEQAGGENIIIVAKKVEDDSLNSEQKAALEDKDVLTVLSLEAYVGETKITEFGGGKVTVTVPFELPEGKEGSDYYVAYIADDGTMTVMPTRYENGCLVFETTHFSSYVVLENTSDEQEPEDTTQKPEDTTQKPEDTTQKPEDTTQKPEDTTQKPEDNVPETGDNSNMILLVMLVIISGACLAVIARRKRATM